MILSAAGDRGKLGASCEPHRICLIDGFRIQCGNEVLHLSGTVERLLALLALRRKPVRRSEAACTLWPDSDEQRAAGSLRSALWSLRRAGHTVVNAQGDALQLTPETATDVHSTLAAADRLMHGEDIVLDKTVWQSLFGQLLPEWYDDWVLVERRRHEETRVQALEALCLSYRRRGRVKQAVAAGRAAVDAEPFRESCRRALMLAHVTDGNLADALRQYLEFSNLIGSELGLAPSSQIEALAQSLRPPTADAALTFA